MNQSELIEKVAQATELNQAAAGHAVKAVVNAILDTLLAGDAVRVSGLGIFNVAARPAREGQTMRLTEAGAIKVFGDVRSGRTMERPGLEALLAYARDGDTLAVVRLDRLGRSLGELLTTVAMLKERGIALLSLMERIDTNSAAGELVFHVFGAIAHFERRLIAERTKEGIAAARAKGKHPGRHPLDPEKIAAALELVKAGLSPTVAARQLGLGRSTVYREVGRAGIAR